jgi:hypothetical protein
MYPFKSAVPMKDLLSLPESAMIRNRFQFNPQDDTWFIADLSRDFSLDFNQLNAYCEPSFIQAFKKSLVHFSNIVRPCLSFPCRHFIPAKPHTLACLKSLQPIP